MYVTALDFSRAFDTINTNILAQRIKSFTTITTSMWFQSYIKGRRQSVKYFNAFFNLIDVKLDIPQDTVLAPTLFNI